MFHSRLPPAGSRRGFSTFFDYLLGLVQESIGHHPSSKLVLRELVEKPPSPLSSEVEYSLQEENLRGDRHTQ
jgi:hypothetical protein